MQDNPYAAPQSDIATATANARLSDAELEDAALFLNLTVLLFLTLQLINLANVMGFYYVALIGYVGSIYYLSKSIRVERPWIYPIGSLVPLINLITLVYLVRKSSALLKAGGYKIGLMGAKKIVADASPVNPSVPAGPPGPADK